MQENIGKKIESRRLRSSYLITTISISLVLFVVGIMGFLLLNVKRLSDVAKENIGFNVVLNKTTRKVDIQKTMKIIQVKPYVKKVSYESPEKIADKLQKELGEDFINTLKYNPIHPTIRLKIHSNFVNPKKVIQISEELSKLSNVFEVAYQKNIVSQIYSNTKKISFYLIFITGILFVVSFALINNTIRLSIFSNRFLIRTMQLVGATHRFIRFPYLLRGVVNGIISSFIAMGMMVVLIYYIYQNNPMIVTLFNLKLYGYLLLIILLMGMSMSWFSTNLAVRKYLRLKTNQLY